MLNRSYNNVGPFNGCHFEFKDSGVFRCNKAYIKIYSSNGEQMILTETKGSCAGFNFSQFIPKDFCSGGIEVGYDISWGCDWPLRHKFVHGGPFKDKILDLNSLSIKISGTTFNPYFQIKDASNNRINYSV